MKLWPKLSYVSVEFGGHVDWVAGPILNSSPHPTSVHARTSHLVAIERSPTWITATSGTVDAGVDEGVLTISLARDPLGELGALLGGRSRAGSSERAAGYRRASIGRHERVLRVGAKARLLVDVI